MKTNSNKKSILIIFLTSMLALMLSVATLFTLPTFSASAVDGVTEDDVVTCRELKVGDKIKTGVTLVVECADNFFIGIQNENETLITIRREMLTTSANSVQYQATMLPMESSNCSVFAYILPQIDSLEGVEIANIFSENYANGFSIDYKLYEYSIPDTSDYAVTDCANGTNLSGKFIRVEYDTKEALGSLMLQANGKNIFAYDNMAPYYGGYGNNTLLFCNDYETYVDIYIPASVAAIITDVLIEDFSNYAINVYELTAPAGVPEEVPEDEKDDFLQDIKDKVNNGANNVSEWIEEHFGVTIAGSTLIIVAIAIVIVLIVRRRRR